MATKPISDLLSRLEKATGKKKVGILIKLAGLYWDLPPNERIAFAEQAVDLSKIFHDRKSTAESYNHLGIAYNNLGDSQKSIDHFLKALQIMEKIKDKEGIAISYRNLGQANFYLDNYDKALEYFQKSLKLQEEIGNKKDISQALIMVGNVKAKTAEYGEAQDYYFNALEMKKEINDKLGISQILNNLGNIYLDKGQQDKALEYLVKALQIDRELDNKWEIANSTHNIAEQYIKNEEPEKAYPYMLESQKLAEDFDNKGLIRDNLHIFSLYYELKEDYPKALNYQREYSELTKSLFSKELSEKVADMQAKYETEKLEELVTERTQELQQKVYELEETEKSLRRSEERLDMAIKGTGAGLWDWNIQTGEIVFNERWAEIVEYTMEELSPANIETWNKLAHPDDLEKSSQLLEKHFAGETDYYICEVRIKHKDGHWVWVLDRGKVFEWDANGKPVRIAGTRLDITERVQAEEELKKHRDHLEQLVAQRTTELKERVDEIELLNAGMHNIMNDLQVSNLTLTQAQTELEQTNKELESFSYSVSHDLRAPLRAIDGFTNILMEDYVSKLDEEGKHLGSVIQQSVRKMGQLIDDLLAFSRLGRASISFSEIEMKKIANAIYQEETSPKERKRISFTIADMPNVEGDPAMMRQLWTNLISNAIKFSGNVKHAVISVSCQEDEDQLTYCIKDNGAGFNMKYKDKLFSVFQRLHSEKEFKGTGVGLALVQQIIQRHGGKVWAEGEVDHGAAFYFSLPKNRMTK